MWCMWAGRGRALKRHTLQSLPALSRGPLRRALPTAPHRHWTSQNPQGWTQVPALILRGLKPDPLLFFTVVEVLTVDWLGSAGDGSYVDILTLWLSSAANCVFKPLHPQLVTSHGQTTSTAQLLFQTEKKRGGLITLKSLQARCRQYVYTTSCSSPKIMISCKMLPVNLSCAFFPPSAR